MLFPANHIGIEFWLYVYYNVSERLFLMFILSITRDLNSTQCHLRQERTKESNVLLIPAIKPQGDTTTFNSDSRTRDYIVKMIRCVRWYLVISHWHRTLGINWMLCLFSWGLFYALRLPLIGDRYILVIFLNHLLLVSYGMYMFSVSLMHISRFTMKCDLPIFFPSPISLYLRY